MNELRELEHERSAVPALLPPEPDGMAGESGLTLTGTAALPPILAGQFTAESRTRVENFFLSVPQLLDAWVNRCRSPHTRRCYREDVLRFVEHLGLAWPEEAHRLLMTTVQDVQAYRDGLLARNAAPKTINRRVSSLSGFYKYVGAAAAELRLPITIPNPAHAQFVGRSSSDPVDETRALTAARARQLMSLPEGGEILAARDRAILKTYLYSGIRLALAAGSGSRISSSRAGKPFSGCVRRATSAAPSACTTPRRKPLSSMWSKLACAVGRCSGRSAWVRRGRWPIAP